MISALILAIGLSQASCQAETILVSNGQVFIDGQFTAADILLEGGVIAAIDSDLQANAATTTIDAKGKFIIPGLIDAHVHMVELGGPYPEGWDQPPFAQAFKMNGEALLASGVTNARVHLFDLDYGPQLKAKAVSACYPSPRLQIGGPGLFGGRPNLNGRQVRGIAEGEDIGLYMQRAARAGIDWLALHNIDAFEPGQLQTIAETAKELGLRLMAEGTTLSQVKIALDYAVDSIEYLPKDAAYPPEILAQLASQSLPAAAPIGFYQRIANAVAGDSAYALLGLPGFLPQKHQSKFASDFNSWLADDAYYTDAPELLPMRNENFKLLKAAGVKLLPASDAGSAGQYHDRSIWTELAAWQSLGIKRNDILVAATEGTANALGLTNSGRIAVGASADLVVIDANDPMSLNSWQPVMTIKGGVVHEAKPDCPMPSARSGHALVATPAHTWMFGGYQDNRALNDIWWRSNDGCWHKDDTPAPFFARAWQTVSYDLARNTFVLFGGKSMQREPFADTWLWDGNQWNEYVGPSPSARSHHTQVYDSARQVTVLFGGEAEGTVFNDVWEWDGERWQQIDSDMPPPSRAAHMSGYDPVRKKVVVFGGVASDNSTRLDDAWAWDGLRWQQLPSMPTQRALASATSTPDGIVMVGGWQHGFTPVGDLWQLGIDGWHLVPTTIAPRAAAAISWLGDEQRLLVHGGSDRNFVALTDQFRLRLTLDQ